MTTLPYGGFLAKCKKVVADQIARAVPEDRCYRIVKEAGIDEFDDPIYDDGDEVIDALDEKRPGVYKLIDSEGGVIAETTVGGAVNGRQRSAPISRARTIDTANRASDRAINAIGEQWGSIATFQKLQLQSQQEQIDSLRAQLAERDDELRALKNQLGSETPMVTAIMGALPNMIALIQDMRSQDALNKELPRLLPGLSEEARNEVIAMAHQLSEQNRERAASNGIAATTKLAEGSE